MQHGRSLPFSGFLDALRDKGYPISVHDHLAVGKLLHAWDQTSPDQLRDALAALVGRDAEAIEEIRAFFDQVYGPPPGPPFRPSRCVSGSARNDGPRAWPPWPGSSRSSSSCSPSRCSTSEPPSRPAGRRPRRRRLPSRRCQERRSPFRRPPPPNLRRRRADQPADRPRLRGRCLPRRARVVVEQGPHRHAPLAASCVARRARRAAGPYDYTLATQGLRIRMPHADVEDAATILARIYAGELVSRELDVTASLRLTLSGGRLESCSSRSRSRDPSSCCRTSAPTCCGGDRKSTPSCSICAARELRSSAGTSTPTSGGCPNGRTVLRTPSTC